MAAPRLRLAGALTLWLPILVLALVWRVIGLSGLEVWRDEALTLLHTGTSWRDLLLRLPLVEDTPPLNFLVYKAWFAVFSSELGARWLPVMAGVATVGMLMGAARRLAPGTGWAAGLLAAFSYEFLVYSQEIRVYSLLLLLTSMSFLLAEGALRAGRDRRWQAGLLVVSAVAAHAHAVGLFVLPMVLLYCVVRAGMRQTWRAIGPGCVVLWGVLVLPMIWFGVHWSRYHHRMGNWWNVPPDRTTIDFLSRAFFGMLTLRRWAGADTWRLDAWAGFWIERLVIIGSVFLLIRAILNPATRRPAAGLLAASALYYGLMAITSQLALPNVVERTALPGWCPIVLAMSLGTAAGPRPWTRWAGCAAAVVVAGVWACSWVWLAGVGPARHDPNVRAFEWMRPRVGPRDLIFSWYHGFEDLTVYRLRDRISADQLLSGEFPVYDGKPPRFLLIPRAPDPDWAQRLEATIVRRQESGEPFKVWMIRKGFPQIDPQPGSPEEIIVRTHMPSDWFGATEFCGTSIVEYVPRPPVPGR